jgi:hypothetical protein
MDVDINIFRLISYLKGDELWDAAEVNGTATCSRLIDMEAILTGNSWYENHAYPVVYEGYPIHGFMRVRRPDPDVLGVPPVHDIYFDNLSQNLSVTSAEPFTPVGFTSEYIAYNLGETVTADYKDIQQQAVNLAVNNPGYLTPRLTTLILQPGPHIRYGQYRFRVSYVIPGINQVTSSYEWELFNRITDND